MNIIYTAALARLSATRKYWLYARTTLANLSFSQEKEYMIRCCCCCRLIRCFVCMIENKMEKMEGKHDPIQNFL